MGRIKHKEAIMKIIIKNTANKEHLSFKKEIYDVKIRMKEVLKKEQEYYNNFIQKLIELEEDLNKNPDLFFDLIKKNKEWWLERIKKYYILYKQLVEQELIPRGIFSIEEIGEKRNG